MTSSFPTTDSVEMRLSQPLKAISIRDLHRHWHVTSLTIEAKRPPNLEEGPWLPAMVRGAWGRQLKTQHESLSTNKNASAYDIFFSERQTRRTKFAIPKPFVISISYSRQTIALRLDLFGFADAWREEAFDALLLALASGIALHPKSKVRVPWHIEEAYWNRTASLPTFPDDFGNSLRLKLITPLCIRHDDRLVINEKSLFGGLLDRVMGMALWQDIAISESWAELLSNALCTSIQNSNLTPVIWERYSINQSHTTIPMKGVVGALELHGTNLDICAAVNLCTTCHVGSHTALGLGRIQITPIILT